MELIDTHAHLTSEGLFERVDEVLARARAASVRQIIAVASDVADARGCLELARGRTGEIFATAGIHPHEAGKASTANLEHIGALLGEPNVVALGEVGLDYYYDFSDRESQQRVFASQLEIARSCDVPVIVHCRDAFDDTIELLTRHGHAGRRVVIHCFTGHEDDARRVAGHGWRISFTGIVTFKRSTELQAIARDYPADQLMIETDAPYLSPVPVRSVRPNEPAHVAHIARFLADLRNISIEELAAATTANARAFFDLPANATGPS